MIVVHEVVVVVVLFGLVRVASPGGLRQCLGRVRPFRGQSLGTYKLATSEQETWAIA